MSWNFQGKTAFSDSVPSISPPSPTPQNANFIHIVVSVVLTGGCGFESQRSAFSKLQRFREAKTCIANLPTWEKIDFGLPPEIGENGLKMDFGLTGKIGEKIAENRNNRPEMEIFLFSGDFAYFWQISS